MTLEIVTSTKIVSTVNGKRKTMRRFNVPVIIPADIEHHIKSYFLDVANEVTCELRTPENWVQFIKNIPDITEGQRGWIASIIWYSFGGESNNVLHKYYKSFSSEESWAGSVDDIIKILDRYGVSKKTNHFAAEREKLRDFLMKELIEEVSHYVS